MRNYRLDAALPEKLTRRFIAVALVAGELDRPAGVPGPTHAMDQVVELGRFVRLACGERGSNDKALAVSNQVEL